jgi:uncharacterized membrane protein YgcG
MGRFACCVCLLAVSLFGLSQSLFADGVHSFNHSVSYCDLAFSDINQNLVNHDFDPSEINHHADVSHEHGTGKAWEHWKHHHGNDNDADDDEGNGDDQGNHGSSGIGSVNTGGSDSGSGGGTVSVPEPSALLLLVIGLAALLLENFRNSLRKLSA